MNPEGGPAAPIKNAFGLLGTIIAYSLCSIDGDVASRPLQLLDQELNLPEPFI